jgi:ribosomal protein S10
MTDQIVDTLKQPESDPTDLLSFDQEQLDAVVVYIAKIARETRNEHNLTDEQKKASVAKFLKIMNSWPKEFCDRVNDRVREAHDAKNFFWSKPADAMIAATLAVEFDK